MLRTASALLARRTKNAVELARTVSRRGCDGAAAQLQVVLIGRASTPLPCWAGP